MFFFLKVCGVHDQSVILLHVILPILNQSTILGKTPTVPPAQQDPPRETMTIMNLMCASLLVSLLAILGKQLLNWYLWNLSGSMIERSRHTLPELPNTIMKTSTHHDEHKPPSQYAGYCSPSKYTYRLPSETQTNFISIKVSSYPHTFEDSDSDP